MSLKLGNPGREGSLPPAQTGIPSAPVRRRRLWAFRLAAILLGVLPFVALEAGLRLFDLGGTANQPDPLSGFGRPHPLFERTGEVYRTAPSRQAFFDLQEFPAQKPANGCRIFCFGGSTVYGHPYLNDTAFPKWLELELNGRDPSRHYEAINCGGISHASFRLAPIVREVLDYQPDLIILAMGHNEFLEDRTYQPLKSRSPFRRALEDQIFSLRIVTVAQKIVGRDQRTARDTALPAEVSPRLDDMFTGYASYHRDDEWRRQLVSQFENTTRAMIKECRAAGVPVLIVALGSKLRDCPPFKSEHRPGLTPAEESEWQSLFEAATRAEETDLNAALALYEKAGAIDGEFALLSYRIARCLDRLGQLAHAREYYLRAKEQDVCPLRIIEPVNRLNRSLAAESASPLLDAQALLESLSHDRLPGSNLYLDHVHPTIGSHQKIARAIADKLKESQLVSGGAWSDAARRAAYRQHFQTLDSTYFSNGRRRVEWLENWARRQRLHEETLPKDARGFLHQGFRALDFEDETAAWRSFRTALAMDATLAKPLMDRALELREEGRPETAERLLGRLAEIVGDEKLKAEIAHAAQTVAN